jgi:L-ascorbate metabolism protein UlaG (beta-lactamase superfamily)
MTNKRLHEKPPAPDKLIEITPLGQAGFRLGFGSITLYIDPYLSNSVETAEGPDLKRLTPIWKAPEMIKDADWALITHTHIDHCDVDTLVPLSHASSQCRFIGPQDVGDILVAQGISSARFSRASHNWLSLGPDLRVHPLPAAHPAIETDAQGGSRYVGYLIEYRGKRIYHSGDTLLNSAIIEAAHAFKPIDVAILPVNERNHYRELRGIIGNMSVREAFQFATELQVDTLIPMHWDMFAPNSVYPEEIETYTRLAQPPFRVLLNPTRI